MTSRSWPPAVFTPFLRRFTDERAYDLAETVSLYRRVAATHRATLWARDDAIEQVSNFVVEQVTALIELPNYMPICQALDKCQHELLALETTIFSKPVVDFSRPLSLKEQVDLNRHLRAQEYFLAHQDRICEQLVAALGNLSGGILQSLPRLAESLFTAPLISLLPKPDDLVDRIIGTIFSSELIDVGLFTVVQDQIYQNMCRFSNVPLDGSSKKALISASDADLSPEDLVDTYLTGTPFHSLLLTPGPLELPAEQRFSGHWIIAPPGRGKTTLLHSMFLDDVKRDASIIVLDSKGDLINPIKNLQCVADRLLLIEPDDAFPLALNPLDIPKSNVAHTISLIEYIMSALLEAKFTSLQSTLFRNVIPAIIETIPDATLETFKAVITHGFEPYQEHFSKLDRRTQAFFLDKQNGFHSKTYVDTRNQIIWRLDFLMTNPVMRAMFAAAKTKLDLGKEMDAGKIIIINNSKALLTDEGAEFFGRFFIALILAAAQQRATKKLSQKLPCYVYIDECHNVIARDPKIPTILDECRSQKIALILAHQRTAQITAPVLDAVSNCAIRMANSDDEAKYLSDKLRTTTEFIRSLPRGTFATFVRDMTPTALALKIPYIDLSTLPQMSPAEQQTIRQRMRAEFSSTPRASRAPAEPASQPQTPATAASSSKSAPASAATSKPIVPQPTPNTDPDHGEAGDPASEW